MLKQILVIEDDHNIRESIVDLLETSNFKVLAAANGKEGLDMALEHLPDLILCDIMMPVMDGYQVVQAVRQDRRLAETPFIFLSAKSQKADVRHGMDLGADDYLTKPFRAQELFDAVETRIWRKEVGTKELQDTRQELEKLNQQMVAISEADIPVAMIISDLKGTIVHFSRGAERLLGFTAGEMVNRQPISVLHLPEEIRVRTQVLSSELGREITESNGFLTEIPNLKSFESREWSYVRKDKSVIPVQLVVSTIRDSKAAITGYLGVAIDISERKAAEQALQYAKEQAENANRMKSQFLANMSHEIRTPMNSILGFSDILLNLVTEPQARKYLSTIVASGRTLMAIINDLLDLAKIEAGKMQLRPEPVNLPLLADEIGQMFAEQLRTKKLEWRLDMPEKMPAMLELDDVRLRQVLINLLGNAVKFTDQGFVRLAVRIDPTPMDPDHVALSISVQDSGIGIPPENQASVFDSFQQVHDTNTTRYGGTGLGLSITKRLAELMGGNISLVSQKGQGSTFTVHLPRVPTLGVSAVSPAQKVSGDSHLDVTFLPATVLVVDDVVSNLELMSTLLSSQPLQIITARDGREGLIKAEALKPDLILMDLRMPEMDGWEACKRIRLMEPLRETPIVACTASLMGNEPVHETFDDVLLKPLQHSRVFEVLCRFLPFTRTLSKGPEKTVPVAETPQEKRRLSDLYRRLHEAHAAAMDTLIDAYDVDRMEELLADLTRFAQENSMVRLGEQLRSLASAVENFDLDNIAVRLRELKDLLVHGN